VGKSPRVAVFFNFLEQGLGETRKCDEAGEQAASVAIGMRERYGYDNVWGLFPPTLEQELVGAGREEEFPFAEQGRLRDIRIPEHLACEPCMEETGRSLRFLRRELGGRHPICAQVTGSMSMPAKLMGIEKWMELLFLGPSGERDALLLKCSQLVNKQIAFYREQGADLIFYLDPFASPDMVTSGVFRELALPWLIRDLKALDPRGIVYSSGSSRLGAVLPQIQSATRLSAFQLSSLDRLIETRSLVGVTPVCFGTINYIKLVRGSTELIRASVRRVIQEGMLSGGDFAISTSVMQLAIPEQSIRELVQSALEASVESVGTLTSTAREPRARSETRLRKAD
jgi:uroporphyrinogen decarboxylase